MQNSKCCCNHPPVIVLPLLSFSLHSKLESHAVGVHVTSKVTLMVPSVSLVTVQLLSELRLSEHTPGAESRDTVTVGLMFNPTCTVVSSTSPQSVTPGVAVILLRVRAKAAQPAGSGLVQRTVTSVLFGTAWQEAGCGEGWRRSGDPMVESVLMWLSTIVGTSCCCSGLMPLTLLGL
jgi:hypothetical protein